MDVSFSSCLQCVCSDPMNCGFVSNYPLKLMESFANFIMHDCYSFVFLSDLSIWFGQVG